MPPFRFGVFFGWCRCRVPLPGAAAGCRCKVLCPLWNLVAGAAAVCRCRVPMLGAGGRWQSAAVSAAVKLPCPLWSLVVPLPGAPAGCRVLLPKCCCECCRPNLLSERCFRSAVCAVGFGRWCRRKVSLQGAAAECRCGVPLRSATAGPCSQTFLCALELWQRTSQQRMVAQGAVSEYCVRLEVECCHGFFVAYLRRLLM
eukprot:s378_g23.t1